MPPKPRNFNVPDKAIFSETPRKASKRHRKGIEIDYQSTSTEDRRGSESFGETLDPRD